jgi:hypothetical protein
VHIRREKRNTQEGKAVGEGWGRAKKKDDDDVFCLFLQKQKIALRHLPFGYSPPRNKEAHAMMLPP